MNANEYSLSKSDERKRLPHVDVEMGSVKEKRETEADEILSDDIDDIEAPLLNEKQFTDEDEQTNNSDVKKNPCSEFLVFRYVFCCIYISYLTGASWHCKILQ